MIRENVGRAHYYSISESVRVEASTGMGLVISIPHSYHSIEGADSWKTGKLRELDVVLGD